MEEEEVDKTVEITAVAMAVEAITVVITAVAMAVEATTVVIAVVAVATTVAIAVVATVAVATVVVITAVAMAAVILHLITLTPINLPEQKVGKTEVMETLLKTQNMKVGGVGEKGAFLMRVKPPMKKINNPFLAVLSSF